MPIRVVRLGSPREPDEGVRLGTVRHPPRGVKKKDYARRNYFDLWLPELAPSSQLISWTRAAPLTSRRWAAFSRRYRREMHQPSAQRLLRLLAMLSQEQDLSVGCYCSDALHCHRTLLGGLLREAGAQVD